jgi:septal ring factor EnvC (AmiA/AmiB activator)
MRAATTYRRLALGTACVVAIAAAAGAGLAGAKGPSLKDKIKAAQNDAGQLSNRVQAQTNRIAGLTQQAHAAGARAMILAAQVQGQQARSQQLAKQLDAAERQLEQLRAQYGAAVKVLEERLVSIYESDTPDNLTVLLDSNGFNDLSTRADYLNALHNEDTHVADRVATLRNQMADHTHRVAGLKQQSDAVAQQLSQAKTSMLASERAANQSAAAVNQARAGTQASLSDARSQVASLQAEEAAQRAAVGTGNGAPAYLGGPYSIPTYIVMCESGGNYHAVNPSSGAGGAYQILPSTWAAYGGQGAPQDAPKAEQDRIAAEIWRDSGPSAWACA